MITVQLVSGAADYAGVSSTPFLLTELNWIENHDFFPLKFRFWMKSY